MERLDKLNLWTLEERRNRSDLIKVFEMANNFSPIPLTKFFELNTNNRTRGHTFKLVKHRCNCEVRRHFSERVVSRWNMLDQATVSAKSENGFKSKLESERKRKMGLFLDWSLLGLAAVFHLWSGRTCELPVSYKAACRALISWSVAGLYRQLADKLTRQQSNSPITNSPTNQFAKIDIWKFWHTPKCSGKYESCTHLLGRPI